MGKENPPQRYSEEDFLWPHGDLNPGPTDYESAALTAELWGQESSLGSDCFAYRVRTSLTL